jgi:hypothetical protein
MKEVEHGYYMKGGLGRTNHELVYRSLGGWPFAGDK